MIDVTGTGDTANNSQLQLINLLDSIAEGIYCVNLEGQCTYCNSSCLRLLRYDDPSELLGTNMHELIHHTRRDGRHYAVHDCRIYKAYTSGQNIHVEDEIFFRQDGTHFDAEYRSYPLKDGGTIVGAVISFVDISVRRHEAAYRNHLARLVESSHDAIFSKDNAGVITSWNQGAHRLFGYDAEEAIGRRSTEIILPESHDNEEQEILDAVRSGNELKQLDVKRRRKNGEILDISLTISPIYDADGVLIGTSFIERDKTEQRRSLEELSRAKSAAERAESLANAANRSRAEFLATVSHELRTPMNAILGMLQLTLTEKLEPRIAEYLRTAKSSADSLLELVNEILDFSKIESGKFEITHAPFDLRENINNAAKTLAPRASEKGLELLCEIDSEIPETMVGDGWRIQQVLTNLVSNAIKFTDVGEIVIEVKELRKLPDEVRLGFSVSDTGIGIRAEDQERIFSAFAQADMSMTRKQQGTGLGLTICRELLLLMGGALKLESQFGQGSRFFFELTLPVIENAAEVKIISKQLMENLSVLVVDDNATNLRILENILMGWLMRPIVADNADQALRILDKADAKNQIIDLAIVDAVMPGKDGFALAQDIAQRRGIGNPPVLIMQSTGELAAFADKKAAAPIAGYIVKPVLQSELLNTVMETLHLYGEQTNSEQSAGSALNDLQRPLTILVAEDLPANQKVVKAILERRGHEAIIADNGQAAVELMRNQDKPFDVVLMDVQMPIMDGFQATAAIRELMLAHASDVPIVAMTAHAMQGDREACLAAGMDAYISKPIDAVQLLEMVEAIVCPPSAAHLPESSPPKPRSSRDKSSATGPVPTKMVELEATLVRLGNDPNLFREFVSIFMEDAPGLLEKIDQAIVERQPEQLEKAAHALKGLTSNFGAKPCVELTLEFEQAGRQNQIDSIVGKRDRLAKLYQNLRTELSTLVQE